MFRFSGIEGYDCLVSLLEEERKRGKEENLLEEEEEIVDLLKDE